MRDRTVLWLVGLSALLLLPAAAALQVDPLEPGALTGALPARPGGTDLNTSKLSLPAGPLPVSAQAGVAAHVDAHGDSETADAASPASVPVAHPPSLPAKVVAIAAPVAQSALVAFLLGALAFGASGLRIVQDRASELLARWGRGLAGLVAGLGLFSRIQRDALLDNPVRARVHNIVSQDPGLSLSDVRTRTGIAWGTAVHHLRRLEDHGLVVSVNRLAHRRYFVADTPAALRSSVAVVAHPTARRIAHMVVQQPGIDQASLCVALGLNNPAASKHLHQFETQGLVLSQRAGRSRHYHPTGALHSALQVLEPTRAGLPGATYTPMPLQAASP